MTTIRISQSNIDRLDLINQEDISSNDSTFMYNLLTKKNADIKQYLNNTDRLTVVEYIFIYTCLYFILYNFIRLMKYKNYDLLHYENINNIFMKGMYICIIILIYTLYSTIIPLSNTLKIPLNDSTIKYLLIVSIILFIIIFSIIFILNYNSNSDKLQTIIFGMISLFGILFINSSVIYNKYTGPIISTIILMYLKYKNIKVLKFNKV